ncbi:MAG: hypothetical protein J5988_12465 [Eubacterium sp.]|nr:hypothetical protein [Eubacterium sp.]
MEDERRKQIYQEIFQRFFMQLDIFLVRRWSGRKNVEEPFSDEVRQEAYLNFYKRVKKFKIANRQTIRRWFGLDGKAMPKREQIIHMAFVLGLTAEETEEYLRFGISEPGFQVNDYSECIAMYCLDNRLDYDTYVVMVEFFERHSVREVSIQQTSRTDAIRKEYECQKNLSKEEFLVWMCKNCGLFKGYSMTTYRVFLSLVDEALLLFREEVQEMLLFELKETDFFLWAKEHNIEEKDYGRAIRRYLKNIERRKDFSLSQEKVREMKRLLVMGYSSKNRVCDLLTELYAPMDLQNCGVNQELAKVLQKEVGNKSAKYVSELLGMSLQKEKMMQLNRAMTELKYLPEEERCPDWILEQFFTEESRIAVQTVFEAERVMKKQRARQEQRVRNIQRADLLILVQYIFQKKCLTKMTEECTYSGEDARADFVKSANTILESCGMRPIDPAYRLDYILLSCFEEEEVFLFAEIFEKE